MVDYDKVYENLKKKYEEEKQRKNAQIPDEKKKFLLRHFLKPGEHTLKILADPNSEIFTFQSLHYLKNNKQWIQCSGDDPICKYVNKDRDNRWMLASRVWTKLYAHLIDTDIPSKYWTAGNTYLVFASRRLGSALTSFMKDVEDDRLFSAIFDPQIENNNCMLIVHAKDQTTCRTTRGKSPKVAVGEWYIPLEQSWLDATKIPTEKEYYDLLKTEGINIEEIPTSENQVTNFDSNISNEVDKNSESYPITTDKETINNETDNISITDNILKPPSSQDIANSKSDTNKDDANHPECFGTFKIDKDGCDSCNVNLDCVKKKGNVY